MNHLCLDVMMNWSTGVKPVPKGHESATPEIKFREMVQSWLRVQRMAIARQTAEKKESSKDGKKSSKQSKDAKEKPEDSKDAEKNTEDSTVAEKEIADTVEPGQCDRSDNMDDAALFQRIGDVTGKYANTTS